MKIDSLIAGVDEAGRGPLAGPVVAAAVILNPNKIIHGIKDSKKLSEMQREKLFVEIKENAFAWAIGESTVEEIDELNILNASLLAMKRAIERLSITPEIALIDGNRCPKNLPCKAISILQGDMHEPAISAASILAKVTRDHLMRELHNTYPEYNFERHKGYPTKFHLNALKEFGPCQIHRRSFGPVRDVILL